MARKRLGDGWPLKWMPTRYSNMHSSITFIGLILEELSKLRFGNTASKLIILNTFCNFESVFPCKNI